MPLYRLRLEAVNLDPFIRDCKQLSVIRGAGLLLLDAPSLLAAGVLQGTELVTSGASMAVFEFEANNLAAAEARRDRAIQAVSQHPQLRHATFVVDVVPASADFAGDRERLIALNRFRQMRSPRIAYCQAIEKQPCKIDGVRPAEIDEDFPDLGNVRISRSTHERREYGRTARQTFYGRVNAAEVPGAPIDIPVFTDDFESLATRPHHPLDRKIAVIHLDGNGFGKVQRECCKTVADQQAFDRLVQHGRLGWLKEHLRATSSEPAWLNGTKYRMEILQWGGDEVTLVVPAWQGWSVLDGYFKASAAWLPFHGRKLTHAGGIVFCHHNTPIHSVTALVHDTLVERGPKKLTGDGNFLTYQVLESFDTLGSDPDAARARYCPAGTRPAALCLKAEDMHVILSAFRSVRDHVPRAKLHQVVHALLNAEEPPSALVDDVQEGAQRLAGPAEWDRLLLALNGPPICWVHLLELWDYLD